jgi:CheY-like chemotaxis protein
VAHDFNNLLVVIQGNAEVALMKSNGDSDQTRRFDRIADAAQRAGNLVRQLLTFSRKQVVQPRPLNLNELIANLTKMMKHLMNEEMVLKFSFAPNLPIIQADPTMMEQIIMNLSVNARDAMPTGGTFTISTSLLEIDANYVATRPESRAGTFVCLSVADTGCGMDAATLARIFEPFFTTKEAGKGTGLGLATVYGIVKQHNGWIDVTSTPGQGSTFHVFFPANASIASPPQTTPARTPTPGQETILVVEDEPDVVELVCSILQDEGYRALEATSALKAMEIWSAYSREIDLVLTDIRMPKGMSGYELAHNLWALRPDIKILFTSGYNVDASMHNIELQEGLNFLAKPYPPRRLLDVVRQRLDGQIIAAAA